MLRSLTSRSAKALLAGAFGLSLALALSSASPSETQEPEALASPAADDATWPEPAPADDGRPRALENARDLPCAQCHESIVDEWAGTLHAMAWVDERYQTAMLKKRKPASCQGCHIPEPLFDGPLDRKLKPRDEVEGPRPEERAEKLAWNPRHFGISCVSCHQAPDGAMLGPYASDPENEISKAHASRQHAAFGEGTEANALCISCHRTNVGPVIGIATDFETTRQADKGLSCVGCHMAPLERSAASGLDKAGAPWASPVREGRSHALQTPRDPVFLREAFGLEPRRAEGGAELLVTNQAGHRVPGLRTRSMTFVVTAKNAAGEALGQTERVYASDAYLPVDGISLIRVEATGSVAALHVRATHDWVGVEEPVIFFDSELEL